jgi:iron complex transport system ATP-binding protein
VLVLDDITVRIGAATLVAGASVRVAPGRVAALLGPNGAGKTTLLRTASGELAPTSGTVTMDGTPLPALSPRARARRRAVVSQHVTLDFAFDVLDVVLMGRTPHTRGRAETRADVAIAWDALCAVRMEAFAERAFPTLSGGEQQRVHLARALAQLTPPAAVPEHDAHADARAADAHADADGPARYLLLDEPTASLDLAHQHGVLRLARRLADDDGVGVLAVLHDLNLAAQYADDVLLLKDGALHAAGPPADVLTPDTIRAVYGLPVLVQPHPCHACPLVVPM